MSWKLTVSRLCTTESKRTKRTSEASTGTAYELARSGDNGESDTVHKLILEEYNGDVANDVL